MDIKMILSEMEIRIEKLSEFEDQANKKNEKPLANILQVRRLEYESFRDWIEGRM